MQPDSGFIVGSRSIFGSIKNSYKNFFAMQLNSCAPSFTVFVAINTPKSTGIIVTYALIAFVLAACAFSEIAFSVIQSVVRYVVTFFPSLQAENFYMHMNFSPLLVSARGVESTASPKPTSVPVGRGQPSKIFCVYNGILTLCQWDKAVRFIKRLNDRVSLHAVFHRSSSQGLLKFSCIIAQVNYAWS
jgi:hypothetical protein